MLIAVIGGKLQGVEAVYLAQKAGFKTLVIDKNPLAPATGFCDQFMEFEFSLEHPVPKDCPKIDLILPAIEDTYILVAIKIWAKLKNIPLAFDMDAYRISSSKLKSDALFKKMDLPAPRPWPDCSFPVVVKPDQASGSQGVEIFKDKEAFLSRFSTQQKQNNIVIQEYIQGPSYSIEVIGCPGQYHTLQVTDLGMDKDYDCKRVTAPTQLSLNQVNRFEKTALTIAKEIDLNGIMDVEVILNKNELKLLEIDARLPSQTPITVYWSTGINMVKMLCDLFLNEKCPYPEQKHERFVTVEHILFSGSGFKVCGEHIMSQDGPLKIISDFFGADEAITSFAKGKDRWVATMIFTGRTQEEVINKRENCYNKMPGASNHILKEKIH